MNDKIKALADHAKLVMNDGLVNAKKSLENLPEGDTRKKLEGLLRLATSGKLSPEDAQRELNKIVKKKSAKKLA